MQPPSRQVKKIVTLAAPLLGLFFAAWFYPRSCRKWHCRGICVGWGWLWLPRLFVGGGELNSIFIAAEVHKLVTAYSEHDLYEAILYQANGKTQLVEQIRPLVVPLRHALDKQREIRKAQYKNFLKFGVTACNTSTF